MNKLYVLGTGSAMVTKCFNTCFTIYNGKEHFLVDAGGGNGILTQLEKAKIDVNDIHNIFISHSHTDHMFGLFWVVRNIAVSIHKDEYKGNLNIYCHEELATTIDTISQLTLNNRYLSYFGSRINVVSVKDREVVNICEHEVQFVDVLSKKELQYGFVAKLSNGKKLTFIADRPYRDNFDELAKDSDWLLHEANCLYSQREIFEPYDKGHVTVKETSEIAQRLDVKNLVMWHSEDKTIETRQETYTKEAREYFDGNIFVPKDLDVIEL